MLRLIDVRRASVETEHARAAALEAEAKAALADVQTQRAGLAKECEQALKDASVQAERFAEERRTKAQQEANALIETARRTIAEERTRAQAETRRAALELGIEIARRFLADVPAELRAEACIERIEHHVATLSEADRAALRDGPVAESGLHVVTAVGLSDDTKAAWRSRLGRALGGDLATTFDVDPALVAGAELHFPTAILRFSWQSALDDMRAEIAADARA